MPDFESARRLLIHGIASAKAGEKASARRFLERVFNMPTSVEQKTNALYWLSKISDDQEEKKQLIGELLAYNPSHPLGLRERAILLGEIQPEDIIDPDNLSPQNTRVQDFESERFTCPTCGGRMGFSPNGQTLVCEYCAHTQSQNKQSQKVQELNFVSGMLTEKGHRKPIAQKAFECRSCGAVYLLQPNTLSLTCAHCGTAYSSIKAETKEILPPEGLIPFKVEEYEVRKNLMAWFKDHKLEKTPHLGEVLGVYMPVWTFDIGGSAKWRVDSYNSITEAWEKADGATRVKFDDLLIPASQPLPKNFENILATFDTQAAVAYQPEYAANWLAESYQVSMSNAALNARSAAISQATPLVRSELIGRYKNLHVSALGFVFESFKLILVPVWFAKYSFGGNEYEAMVNGQTNQIFGKLPPTNLEKLGSWLIGKGWD